MSDNAVPQTVRVLVCFDERAAAQAIIRGAARLATERRAELYALYIEPPGASTRRSPEAAAQLARNRRLAGDLGAQMTILHSHRVADAILAFAREHAIDVIVLGRSSRTRWRRLFDGDIVARVVAQSRGVDVQVLAE